MTAAPPPPPDPANLPPFLRAWLRESEDDGAPCDWFIGEPSVDVISRETLAEHVTMSAIDDLDDAEDFLSTWSMSPAEHEAHRQAAARAAELAREQRRARRDL